LHLYHLFPKLWITTRAQVARALGRQPTAAGARLVLTTLER
jgi:hypothetical protein